MDLNQIKHNFKLGSMKIEDIKLLIDTVEKQQNELKEAQYRELSYIDDIEQMEGMLSQANQENKLLQDKLLDCKRKTTYAVYEENLKLAEELALIKGEMSE